MALRGRHYETGTITDALGAMGVEMDEATVLGASGGVAFGCFVFEYTGQLPHVALLPRNTFSPFERALDNLGIRRDVRETTNEAKGVENLNRELDMGNPVIVWADMFSLPYTGLDPKGMWVMRPLLVLGRDGDDYLLADGSSERIRITAEELLTARARVKKDRLRTIVLERPDEGRLTEGLAAGIETCAALYLDKPPAGSANNFGIAGLRHWAKMLTDERNAKGWPRTFPPGPRLAQALAGRHGQPGVWDWVTTWGTADAADRGTYARFLRQAADRLQRPKLLESADLFDQSAAQWRALAISAMPDQIPAMRDFRQAKREHQRLWIEQGLAADTTRAQLRVEMAALFETLSEPDVLAPFAADIRSEMADRVGAIADLEEAGAKFLRA